jgi:hypothetical protein
MLRAIALLCALCSILSAQSPTRELYTEAVLSGPLPGLYNGHLYFIDRPNRVRLFSPDGNFATSFEVPDRASEPAYVEGIAIDADGTIADGWGTRGTLHGIEIRDESGKLIRAIDTGLFVPNNLTFAPDHSLWVFGWQRDAERPQYPAKDYLTLRHYSSDGKEIGSYLPRSLFPPGLNPGSAQSQERRIFVTAEFIGIVAFSGNVGSQQEWVEVDLNGNIRGRWRLDGLQFPSVGLTSDRGVYARQRDPKTRQDRIVVRPNRATSTWQVVPITAEGVFYGADGDDWSCQLAHGSDGAPLVQATFLRSEPR